MRNHGATSHQVWVLVAAWQVRLVVLELLMLVAATSLLPAALGLPTLSSEHLATPSTLITTWLAAVLAAQASFEPSWDIYATAGQRPRCANLARVAVVALAGATISAVGLGNVAMSFTGTAAMLGVAMLGGATLGHRLCWIAPTAYLLVIIGAGAATGGEPRLWATPANEAPGTAALLITTTLLATGVAAWWRSVSRQAALQSRD